MINQITVLVLLHFISDFLLQPGNWAAKKLKFFRPLLFHSIQYAIPFLVAFYFLGINMLWTLLIFGSHLAIDNKKFLLWWNRVVKRDNVPEWVMMVQDQVLHLIVIAFILMMSSA